MVCAAAVAVAFLPARAIRADYPHRNQDHGRNGMHRTYDKFGNIVDAYRNNQLRDTWSNVNALGQTTREGPGIAPGSGDRGTGERIGGGGYGGSSGGGWSGGGRSRGRDCFLTTVVATRMGEADDGETLTVLRWFRDTIMRNDLQYTAMLKEYYEIAPPIAKRLETAPMSEIKALYQTILRVKGEIEEKNYEQAVTLYRHMVNGLRAPAPAE